MKLSNKQIINEMRSQIMDDRANGAFRSNLAREELFMTMPSDSMQLAGIVLTEPHIVETFMSVFYDRIVRKGYVENLSFANRLAIFHTEDNPMGASYSRTMIDILASEAYDNTASPVPVEDAMVVKEVFADAIVKRVFPFSFSYEQMKSAFLEEFGLNSLLTQMFSKLDKSKQYYIETVLIAIFKDLDNFTHTHIQDTDFHVLFNLDLTALATTLDALIADTALAQARAFKIFLLALTAQLEAPTRLFNVGDADGAFMSSIEPNQAVLLIHPTLYSTLLTISDEMFGSKSEFAGHFSKIIPIDLTTDGTKVHGGTVAVILDPKLVEYSVNLDKTLEWTNPKALYTNYFGHLWFQTLVNPFLNALCVDVLTHV